MVWQWIVKCYDALKRLCFAACVPEDKDRLRQRYFESGTYYYVVARYAVFAGAVPTAGNLFHHAIEMYLKGYLCRQLDEPQRKKLSHSLKRCWKVFKRSVGDPSVARYDNLIQELDKFENIRYPEVSIRLGAQIYFDITQPPPGMGPVNMHPPVYKFIVNELDELVSRLFRLAGVNPQFFVGHLRPDGITFLKRDNPTVIW